MKKSNIYMWLTWNPSVLNQTYLIKVNSCSAMICDCISVEIWISLKMNRIATCSCEVVDRWWISVKNWSLPLRQPRFRFNPTTGSGWRTGVQDLRSAGGEY